MKWSKKNILLLAGAWVLWSRTFFPGPPYNVPEWEVSSGHPTYEQCVQFYDRAAAREDKKKFNEPHTYFVCLPETVDPRRPTAKEVN